MCVDEQGHRIATNLRSEMKGRKCERQIETALPITPGAKPAPKSATKSASAASPADFPKVGADTQKARDDIRRKVLTEELTNEQRLLDNARLELAENQAPRPSEDRSSQKSLNRVSDAEKSVQRHQKNVESLQREIGNLK